MAEKKKDNDKTSVFKKELKDFFDSSFKFSKKGLKKAGEAITDFGDTSVIKIDIAKYNLKLEKKYYELGKLCAESFIKDKKTSVSKKDEKVIKILEAIEKIKKSIESAEKKLKEKTAGTEKKAPAKKAAATKSSVKKAAPKKTAKKSTSSSSDKTIVMGTE